MSKQLFNTTEKSNFILNMTEEKYSQLATFGLSASYFTTAVFAVIPEFAKKFSYSIVSGGLAISGVICMVLALIGIMKKYIDRKKIFPVCAFSAMIIWGIVSLINSYSVSTSFYGFSGRGEGLLAIIFYFGFFITAMSVKREKTVNIVINSVIASGLLHSVVALIQIFNGGLSHYRFVFLKIKANAASGLAQSPIFLAMVLSLSLTASLVMGVTTDNKKKRIFCIVSSCLFSFVMMFTYSLMGIAGIISGIILAVIAVFISKSPKIRLVSLLSAVIPAIVSVIIVNAGLVGEISSYKLYDGYTLWWADSYIRLSASGDYDNDKLDISDTMEVYKYLNNTTCDIIRKYPLVGTGPDQLVYPQLYTNGGLDPETSDISTIIAANRGTFDKVYNEYLYTAATRGIPSLIALILVLGSVMVSGFRKIKKSPSDINICTFMMFICGIVIFFIGCSNITFSPIFWAISGLLMCSAKKE
ncbi:MAG: O-antigen ligase family protein [Ruminococcus sp.]|nr:O-antigen ligase family protein [Ruminococcus sp.]